jgi:hypothetical protein
MEFGDCFDKKKKKNEFLFLNGLTSRCRPSSASRPVPSARPHLRARTRLTRAEPSHRVTADVQLLLAPGAPVVPAAPLGLPKPAARASLLSSCPFASPPPPPPRSRQRSRSGSSTAAPFPLPRSLPAVSPRLNSPREELHLPSLVLTVHTLFCFGKVEGRFDRGYSHLRSPELAVVCACANNLLHPLFHPSLVCIISASTSWTSCVPHRPSPWPELAYHRRSAPPRRLACHRARFGAPLVPSAGASGPPCHGEGAGGDHTAGESRPVSAALCSGWLAGGSGLTHGPVVSHWGLVRVQIWGAPSVFRGWF